MISWIMSNHSFANQMRSQCFPRRHLQHRHANQEYRGTKEEDRHRSGNGDRDRAEMESYHRNDEVAGDGGCLGCAGARPTAHRQGRPWR